MPSPVGRPRRPYRLVLCPTITREIPRRFVRTYTRAGGGRCRFSRLAASARSADLWVCSLSHVKCLAVRLRKCCISYYWVSGTSKSTAVPKKTGTHWKLSRAAWRSLTVSYLAMRQRQTRTLPGQYDRRRVVDNALRHLSLHQQAG